MRRRPQPSPRAAAAVGGRRVGAWARRAAALLAVSTACFWLSLRLHAGGTVLRPRGATLAEARLATSRQHAPPPAPPPPPRAVPRAAAHNVPADWGGVFLAPGSLEVEPEPSPPSPPAALSTVGVSGAQLLEALPRGASLFVTFATGAMSPFAFNWVAHARALALRPLLIGALDDEMAAQAAAAGVPAVRLDGRAVLAASAGAKYFSTGNAAFRRMGAVKTAFLWELLSHGLHPVLSDADVVWLRDPRPHFGNGSLAEADILVSTDCIEIPNDEAGEGAGTCDKTVNFNTGVLHFRATPAALEFVDRWHAKVATSNETWMRDQPAFNLLARGTAGIRMTVANPDRPRGDRALLRGCDGLIRLGVLSPALFANGHTFFVQEVHRNGREPYSVHLTYQYGDDPRFAFGKRQRLRQAGLWAMEEPAYSEGRFLVLADDAASFPPVPVGRSGDDWREALRRHFAEDLLRRRAIRGLLAAARALGRVAVLPRTVCYCDKLWNNLVACRAAGAESMPLPFECPMDHIFNVPHWIASNVSFREAGFLEHSRLRRFVTWARVRVLDASDAADADAPPLGVVADAARHTGAEGSWDAPDAVVRAGISDAALAAQLAPLADVTVLELSSADALLCGLSSALPPPPGPRHVASTPAAFNGLMRSLLDYKMWFCLTEPWAKAGKPGLVPGVSWEGDVVTRHCGVDEGALRRGGRIRFGVLLDEPSCACEWGYAMPPELPVLPGAEECSAAQRAAASRLLTDDGS